MTKCKTADSSTSRRWQILWAVIPACLLGCATDHARPSADDPDSFTAAITENGVTRTIAISGYRGSPADGTAAEKSGCTHIRFCTTPGTDWITCDTNDRSCSSNARFAECRSDAQAVCGKLTPMVFDPPIPCPISGVCSASQGELGSIGFP